MAGYSSEWPCVGPIFIKDLLSHSGCSELEREARKHESQLADLDVQQRQMLDNVRRDTAKLESERHMVISQLERERCVLQSIELKIKDLSRSIDHTSNFSKIGNGDQDSDSGNEDGDVFQNLELDHNLKRLALLDKTQEEIEKLSKAVVRLHEGTSTKKQY